MGSMVVVGLVWFVFHNVVPRLDLNAWVGAFAVLTLWRMIVWWRYREADFTVQGRTWLRHAVLAAFIGGVLWGLGSLFLFPPGLLVYQLTFMVTLAMMATAAMFSYSPHYRTYFAYFTPAMVPGIIALELQREPPQEALGVGLLLLCCVVLVSVRTYNRMFLESLALRLEKIDLVAQLTAQKDVAEAANLAKSRFLAAASHDLRQPVHALNLYLGAFSQMELPKPAGVMMKRCVNARRSWMRCFVHCWTSPSSTPERLNRRSVRFLWRRSLPGPGWNSSRRRGRKASSCE